MKTTRDRECQIYGKIAELVDDTWGSPIFGDAFGEISPVQREAASALMARIAVDVVVDLNRYVHGGTGEQERAGVLDMVKREILPKTIAFCPALTVGELDDAPRLSDCSTAVGLMYWADQTMDRGSMTMHSAVRLLGADLSALSVEVSGDVQRKFNALMAIQDKVHSFARPEDAPLVLDCFYGQVLVHEARMRDLSIGCMGAGDRYTFLGRNAERIAASMVIDAGFPSVSSSLYAIYRHHDPSLPALPEVYADSRITEMLQTCNAAVRLWDEIGDWQKDRGDDPSQGVFAINLFNQYHPAIIEKFCGLAGIHDTAKQTSLQELFATFHASDAAREVNGIQIEGIFYDHIRDYMRQLPGEVQDKFGQYVTLCKRVLEIGYVNRAGDVALTDTAG